jgi:hypothetical protein
MLVFQSVFATCAVMQAALFLSYKKAHQHMCYNCYMCCYETAREILIGISLRGWDVVLSHVLCTAQHAAYMKGYVHVWCLHMQCIEKAGAYMWGRG